MFAAADVLLVFEGDEVALVAPPLGVLLVLVPWPGLGLPVSVADPAEVMDGVGDGVEESVGPDPVVADVDELFFGAEDVDEGTPADCDAHDATAAGVVGASDVTFKLWPLAEEDWAAAPPPDELDGELAVGLDPVRLAIAD